MPTHHHHRRQQLRLVQYVTMANHGQQGNPMSSVHQEQTQYGPGGGQYTLVLTKYVGGIALDCRGRCWHRSSSRRFT